MAANLSNSRARDLILAEALAHVPGYEPDTLAAQVAPLAGGSLNHSYRVRTAAGSYVVRLSPEPDAWLVSDRRAERRLHGIAADAGLAPPIVHADPRDRWLVTQHVDGRLWSEADFAAPDRLQRLAELLQRVHALPAPSEGRVDVLHSLQKYTERIAASGQADRGSFAPLLERAAERWEATGAGTRAPAPVHHDLNGSNIIDNERRLTLIDWECAAVSDPLLDIACVLSYYEVARPHASLLLTHAGLDRVTPSQLQAAVWIFDLHTLLWYRERRLRLQPTEAELDAERALSARLGLALG
jgi:aminoglycoside phosphotransferase (APT) family kinase protein